MSYYRRHILLSALSLVLAASSLQAGVVISVTPAASSIVVPTGGATKQLQVTATIAADAGTQQILGYQVPIDLSPPTGPGMPAGWSVSGINALLTFSGANAFVDVNQRATVDVYASAFKLTNPPTGQITLTTAPVPLYEFTIEFNDQSVAGNYVASIVGNSPVDFSVIDGTGAAIAANQISFNNAAIELTAVPEPSALMLSIVSLAGVCHYRRRRP